MNHTGLSALALRGMRRLYADVTEISEYRHKFSDPVPTICLKNVRVDPAHVLTDHAWIQPKSMHQEEVFPRDLAVGDTIGFVAGIAHYEKGHFRQKKDYGLVNVRFIEVISKRREVCNPITAE